MTPLQDWLDERQVTQSDLAEVSGVNRSDVSRMVSGSARLRGKLRDYIESKDAFVVRAQDAHVNKRMEQARRRLEPAA